MDIRMNVTLDLSGADRFINNFSDNIDLAIEETADKVVLDTIANIEQQGLVKTGTLVSSVGHYQSGKWRRIVEVGTPYAAAHEFGSAVRNFRPRPFLRPAFQDNRKTLIERLANRVFKP